MAAIQPIFAAIVALALCLPFMQRVAGRDNALRQIVYGGFAAKMIGSFANYSFTRSAFGDLRDAEEYHRSAQLFAASISTGNLWPRDYGSHLDGPTERLAGALGWFYWFVGDRVETAFVAFAFISYLGALMIFSAARMAVPSLQSHRFAAVVFLSPTMVFHPSVVGKDAWMILSLGIVSLGIAFGISEQNRARSGLFIVMGVALAAFARPHIAAVIVLAVAATILSGRGFGLSRFTRTLTAAALVAGGFYYLTLLLASKSYGSIDQAFALTSTYTEYGGSSFSTRPLNSPAGIVVGLVTVIFRPFIFETAGVAQLAAAVEGSLLAFFAALSWKRLRQIPAGIMGSEFLRFCFFFFLGVVPLLATISNFGTLTRQRAQVWPFLLIFLCVGQIRPTKTRSKPDASGEGHGLIVPAIRT